MEMLTDFEGSQSPREALMEILTTVDLHHGEYSADPPWALMHIVGLDYEPGDDVWISEALNFPVALEKSDSGFTIRRV
jgi:hypothetical protein